ncbi:tetratricopeptide repeat protein [Streptomyces coffeae]|uniref:Tetratricopeptide repeat protein n=1 Tax=Streptomyces coffeae TaxID=621382 RepID=A0ABS1NP83_9ACTN|nr:tetratricopeptide repeat protein [Streptomyces coffeae]MBL1101896.1 tetratricopeptide repeat protein [Streptomyces coffeae]
MDAAQEDSHKNSISGLTRLYGPTVQARDVHGGIHVHAVRDGAAPPPPRQLLPVSAHFTDRCDDLAALGELLTRAGRNTSSRALIVVSGPAGIGKTTLVCRWLRSLSSDFPDGQFYADLRGHSAGGPAGPGEVLDQFLRALGAGALPVDVAEKASLWRSWTADARIAVMLDNAFTAAQVRPLLCAGSSSVTVVTSRRKLTGLRMDGASFRQLGALGTAAGVELFSRAIGEDRVATEPHAARQVVTLCAGVPLAVCLASARLASRPKQPVKTLADALTRNTERLAALEVEGEATVSKALDASYAVLSEGAALLYRRLGLLPVRTFDSRTAAASCGEPLGWAEARLDELVEANLVEDVGPNACRFHDLVQIHAHGRASAEETASAREEALRRVCDWYLETATEAEKRLTPAQFTLERTLVHPAGLPVPFTDDPGALAWLDSQRMNLMALVRAAFQCEWNAMTWQLVDAMWPVFLRLRYYNLWLEAHQVGLEAAQRERNAEAERQMLNSGAIGLSAAGRIDDAAEWYSQSLRAARDAGDVRDEGQALLGIGTCHREAGRMAEARLYLNQAIAVWENCGYPRGAALARIVLGEIALAETNPSRAIEHFNRAHAGLLAVNDPHDAARALAFLGRARVRAGEHTAGAAAMQEALAVFSSSGAAHWQARTLEMLGDSAWERGDTGPAADFRAQAIVLFQITSPTDARRLRDLLAQT